MNALTYLSERLKRVNCWWIMLAMSAVASLSAAIPNGDFEAGLKSWHGFWSRDPAAGGAFEDRAIVRSGKAAARIEHRGRQDWSFEPGVRIEAQPGDAYEYSGWFKVAGLGSVTLCVSTWDRQGEVVDWAYGARSVQAHTEWQLARSRFIVPEGAVRIQPRIIGYGPGTNWVDDIVIQKLSDLEAGRRTTFPALLTISNATLRVEVDTHDGALRAVELRARRSWNQHPIAREFLVRDAAATSDSIRLTLLHVPSGLEMTAGWQLSGNTPELALELSGSGDLPAALKYPYPFATAPGDYLVIPMNEGISYPVEDLSIEPFRLVAYGGHGICMAFWGVTDGAQGQMAILETPDDAAIKLNRMDRRLVVSPEWDPQKMRFGPARRLRYVFFDTGGHVAIAKRYRAYARGIGLVKTLAEKRRENPQVDLLVGAVNIWCWDRNAVPLVKEIQAAGIQRILWSNAQSPANLQALNDLGVLTSRYDIYQDVMDPANFPRLQWIHSDWTTAAWPKDLIRSFGGDWIKGWGVETKAGGLVSCGVLCDRQGPAYARARIPADLASHPYRCRFIDTTTAAPWHECYDPNHPMTRSDSRRWKMELLRYVSEDARQVTGCETGHDAAVPFLHYFEGMLSLGPYRVPDAGRRMSQIWTNVPDAVAKFQVGHRYRLPLWELVYHDCVVAQWYWGDYNNKLPALWTQRDLFNVLYGTPPMFMFDRQLWEQNKARFVQSYERICPFVRKAGYSEMLDHRFLRPDRSVQQTVFANHMVVTVNFGESPFRLSDQIMVPALSSVVNELADPGN